MQTEQIETSELAKVKYNARRFDRRFPLTPHDVDRISSMESMYLRIGRTGR
jgi:hypothetical protein